MKAIYKIRQKSSGLYLAGTRGYFNENGRPFHNAKGAKCSLGWFLSRVKRWPNVYRDPGPLEVVTFEFKEVAAEDIT